MKMIGERWESIYIRKTYSLQYEWPGVEDFPRAGKNGVATGRVHQLIDCFPLLTVT